jgi:hypothetical protein
VRTDRPTDQQAAPRTSDEAMMPPPTVETTGPAIDVVLGSWLFISAFLWQHGAGSFNNTWMSGALLGVAGLFAPKSPLARSICGVVALWLVVSTLLMAGQSPLTYWNNLSVGVVVLVATFLPQARQRARRARAHAG